MILEVSENWMDNKESYTLILKNKKVWLSSLLSPVSEYTGEQMGARGEEKKQLTSYPKSERVYISYGWTSRFGQTPEFPIHKENFQFDIRLNHTRMKGSLFYLQVLLITLQLGMVWSLLISQFQRPLAITGNFTRTRTHKFQNFQFQKKPTNLQWCHSSPLPWGDLEVAEAEEGLSWWSCSP